VACGAYGQREDASDTTGDALISSYSKVIVADGPRAYWRLGDAAGKPMADAMAAFPGRYVNSPVVGSAGAISGDSDTAVDFNGTSSYATVPFNSALNSSAFSFEAWVRPASASGTYRAVASNRSWPKGWIIYINPSNAWSFWLNSGTTMLQVNGPAIVSGSWTHVAATFDGANATLYVNGVKVAARAVSSFNANATTAFMIGKGQPGDGYYFPGRVDEAAVYDRALSADRILAHFQAASASPPPVPVDAGSTTDASTTTDSSTGTTGCSEQTMWRPRSGFLPLSDADALARVCKAAEIRPANATANAYVPSATELATFRAAKDTYGDTAVQANPYNAYVTGGCGSAGRTTDEIIQCTAAKWGIPADWLRAQYTQESWWNHTTSLGDKRFVGTTDALLYPAFSREKDSSGNLTGYVWESVGISQVKWRPDGSDGAGTEPLRWQSTAFNADYQAADVRFSYDDPQGARSSWGDATYTPGEDWWSIGGWFEPYPWHNSGQASYVSSVQNHLAKRDWAQPGF
jgi:hypothetical protein